jgi:hypothetical protein
MRQLIDQLSVLLLIAASLAYVLLALGPKALRQRAAGALAAGAAQLPSAFRLRRAVLRLSEALGAQAAGACGGCNGCGAPAKDAGGEIRVPLARLGRRGVSSR